MSAIIFAAFHIPNPVLMPVTLLGGYILSKVFIATRNLLPLALAQALVGSLLAITLPAAWHHGLRVGPGYYRVTPGRSPLERVPNSPLSEVSRFGYRFPHG